jgi:hypothetical protein
MNSTTPPPEWPWPDDARPIDVDRDAAVAVESVKEAVAVTIAAVEAGQNALQSIEANASPAKLREVWHVHLLLALQATRLVDACVRRLDRAVDRLRRAR